ncbi:MAG: response regulator transcription factor [Gemmatimonadaceae bacterium]|jgi:two-component system response regulator MtrA|nr:response regulator transcription factor [Gemmatimonadaceae bacterium]
MPPLRPADAPGTRILVVEDNADLAFGLRRTLEAHGYLVDLVGDGTRALEHARTRAPQLIILDLMIPGLDGFAVLAELRRTGSRTPVLILSARGEEADKVRGLQTGADDYVTKPFGVRELVERVGALLRRVAAPPRDAATARSAGTSERLHVGDVVLDVAARRAMRADAVVPLTPLEFDLLLTLARHPGVALSRATLLRDVWGHAPDIQTRTVDLHIAELRRKIERTPAQPRHIRTVFKTGYRFDP